MIIWTGYTQTSEFLVWIWKIYQGMKFHGHMFLQGKAWYNLLHKRNNLSRKQDSLSRHMSGNELGSLERIKYQIENCKNLLWHLEAVK